jgi:Electron transfer DM13
MQSKKVLFGVAGVIAIGVAWYAFRPELLFVNQAVSESIPAVAQAQSSTPQAIAEGNFRGVAHETKGAATIFQLADGKRVLRFTGFETSNGPDVRVLMVAAQDASDSDTVKNAGYVEVGKLKGNVGDQNYDLPAGLDLNKYKAVTIWCNRFSVNFATAPLGFPTGRS